MAFVYNFKEGTWKTITECSNGSSKHFFLPQSAQLVNERFLCWLCNRGLTCTDLISSVNTVLCLMWKKTCGRTQFLWVKALLFAPVNMKNSCVC